MAFRFPRSLKIVLQRFFPDMFLNSDDGCLRPVNDFLDSARVRSKLYSVLVLFVIQFFLMLVQYHSYVEY